VVNSALIDKITSRLEIPRRLRALVRARESSLIALAALVGAIAGVLVALMSTGVDVLHRLFFHLDAGVRLSGLLRLDPVVAISVPLAGGLVFGVARELIAYYGGQSGKSIRSKPMRCMAAVGSFDTNAYAVISMGALAASVIGGPL
jgi:CIC family chloride channel protein